MAHGAPPPGATLHAPPAATMAPQLAPPTPQGKKAAGWFGRTVGTWVPGYQTATQLSDTASELQNMLANPYAFANGVTLGIYDAIHGRSAAGAPGTPTASLGDRVSQIVLGGVSTASGAVLHRLLEHSETYDIDPNVRLKDTAIETLEQARLAGQSTTAAAQSVWNTLNQYHIIVGGVYLNVKNSSDEAMRTKREAFEGKNNDGVSPITSLARCQDAWRDIRKKHPSLNVAPPSPTIPRPFATRGRPQPTDAELIEIKALESKTSKMVTNFAKKSVNYATMYIIHQITNQAFDPNIYKQVLEKGGDIEEGYLELFEGSFRKVLYRWAFRIIGWLIEPIISPTIEQVVVHLRTFLQNDVELLHFVERKVGDMADYYGRIEKARKDYLNTDKRTDECGTFSHFLEETIQVYGKKKYTKEQLTKAFGDYIVENFVPRPAVTVWGHRIPLISTFLEWLGHSIRKAIVRHVLEKTQIVQNMLTQGTDSVHYAQLGLKRLMEQKLTQVCEMITHSRTNAANPLVPNPQLELERKKAELISRQLHLAIQRNSTKLLQFIDIESCNEDDRKLADLDNRVSAFVQEMITAVSDVFKSEPFSIRRVLEDASTAALETALVTLFENKGKQIEEQLQTVLEVLDKSYAYVKEEDRAENERQFRQECADVERNLNTLQEQLSRAAVEAALEKHLKNVSGEKHKGIKAYVQKEKELFEGFNRELEGFSQSIQATASAATTPSGEFNKTLSATITLIEQYLSHITVQLRSPELEECYSDVKGDLHNIYSAVIVQLNRLQKFIEKAATSTDMIKAAEEAIGLANTCRPLLQQFPITADAAPAQSSIKTLQEKLPIQIRETLKAVLETVSTHCATFEQHSKTLTLFDQRVDLQTSHAALLEKKRQFEQVEIDLKLLAQKSREFHDLQGTNNKYPTADLVNAGRIKIKSEMDTITARIYRINDPNFVREISNVLQGAGDTEALFNLLNPSWLASHVPLFASLVTIKKGNEEAIAQAAAQIAALPAVPQTREEITAPLETARSGIMDGITQVLTRMEQNEVIQKRNIVEQAAAIKMIQQDAFVSGLPELQEIGQHFAVKGCISVGEIKTYNTLAPQLVARIAPEIIKGTRTMIDAMGKPFHYEQLILRLVFLDIADRHAASNAA